MSNTRNKRNIFFFASVLAMMFLLLLSSCAPGQKAVFGKAIGDTCTTLVDCDESENCVNSVCVAAFTLTSTGISAEGVISSDYVCSDITVGDVAGGEQSPQLTFTNIPSGTQSIIVGILDEDALVGGGAYNGGTIIPVSRRPGYEDSQTIHWWFYFPVPAGTTTFTIDANTLPDGAIVGQNSIDYNAADINSAHSYAPLCPLEGEAHEYWITAVAYRNTISAGTTLGRYNDFRIVGTEAMLENAISSADLFGYYPCDPLEDSSCVAGVRYVAGRLCNEDMDCWSGYCKNIIEGIGNCYAACGDGYQEIFEACDDGNRSEGDGCSADCQLEPGYTCTWGAARGCSGILCTDSSLSLSGGSLTTCQADSCSRDFSSYVDCTDQRACEELNLGQLEPITIWCNDRCRPRAVVPYVTDFGMVVGSTLSIAQECAEAAPRSTCDNNILDGDETDVDCGGSCPACPILDNSCTSDADCPSSDCINLECTDVINQIGNVLQSTTQTKLQKFAALANILRSYFSSS